jgi:uncharacterized paraquat-inducible protein A
MTHIHEFTIAEVPCPQCDHIVFEFVVRLAIDPNVLCIRCQHVFQASNDSVIGGLGDDDL